MTQQISGRLSNTSTRHIRKVGHTVTQGLRPFPFGGPSIRKILECAGLGNSLILAPSDKGDPCTNQTGSIWLVHWWDPLPCADCMGRGIAVCWPRGGKPFLVSVLGSIKPVSARRPRARSIKIFSSHIHYYSLSSTQNYENPVRKLCYVQISIVIHQGSKC